MKKRLIFLVFILILTLALSACGSGKVEEELEEVKEVEATLTLEHNEELEEYYSVLVEGENAKIKLPEGVDSTKSGSTNYIVNDISGELTINLTVVVEESLVEPKPDDIPGLRTPNLPDGMIITDAWEDFVSRSHAIGFDEGNKVFKDGGKITGISVNAYNMINPDDSMPTDISITGEDENRDFFVVKKEVSDWDTLIYAEEIPNPAFSGSQEEEIIELLDIIAEAYGIF